MCKLLPVLLLMGSALFAAPISITGTFVDGFDQHSFGFSGPGVNFHGASEGAGLIYTRCLFYQFVPCDLSDDFAIHFDCVTPGNICWDITYNAQTLKGPCVGDGCGVTGGTVEISAPPFLFGPTPCLGICTTDFPISLSGEVSATYNTAMPLFDLRVSGTGTMTAFWTTVVDQGVVVVSHINGSFSGEANPVPEPSTWVVLATGLLLMKFRKTHRVRSTFTGSVANSAAAA